MIETHEHAGDFQRAMSEVGQIPLCSDVLTNERMRSHMKVTSNILRALKSRAVAKCEAGADLEEKVIKFLTARARGARAHGR